MKKIKIILDLSGVIIENVRTLDIIKNSVKEHGYLKTAGLLVAYKTGMFKNIYNEKILHIIEDAILNTEIMPGAIELLEYLNDPQKYNSKSPYTYNIAVCSKTAIKLEYTQELESARLYEKAIKENNLSKNHKKPGKRILKSWENYKLKINSKDDLKLPKKNIEKSYIQGLKYLLHQKHPAMDYVYEYKLIHPDDSKYNYLSDLKYKSGNTFLIDDSLDNIAAAHALNIRTIFVSPDKKKQEKARLKYGSYICENTIEVQEYFQKMK